MSTQASINKAITAINRARIAVRELKLPGYKRVRIGDAYKKCAAAYLNDAKREVELLKQHLEEQ